MHEVVLCTASCGQQLGFPGGDRGKEPACQCRRHETRVQPMGWEDLPEEGMVANSSILAWRISMDRGAWRATVHGVTRSQTRLKRLSTHAARG